MIGKNFFIAFISLVVLSFNGLYANNENMVVASISKSEIPVGETFVVTITVEDLNTKLSAPDIENAKLLGSSQKRNIAYINGERRSTSIYAYTYRAESIGHSTVHPIEVSIKRKNYYTDPIYLSIVENTNPQSNNNSNNGNNGNSGNNSFFNFSNNRIENIENEIFIKSTLSKTNVYIYEPLYLEQNVYISDSVFAEIASFDKAGEKNDFLARRDTNKYNAKRETIDGKKYTKHILSREALFAIFSGELSIVENTYSFNTSSKMIGFNDKIRLGGQTLTVDVKPLPESGKPSNFSGGVGQFDFDISVDKSEISQDESFILKVATKGMGYTDVIDLPNIENIISSKYGSTLNIYPPKQFSTNEIKDGKVYGQKIEEYMIVVKDESSAYLGKIELEPIEFSFFSPTEEKYITLTTQKIEIAVLGDNNAIKSTSEEEATKSMNSYEESVEPTKTIVSENSQTLRDIKDGTMKVSSQSIIYQQSFMYIYLSIATLLLALSFLVKKFVIPHFIRKKEKASAISFDNAIKYLQNGDVRSYVKEIEKIFYENISAKLKQKVSNNIEMKNVFVEKKVAITTQERAENAISSCHYILYSPASNADRNFVERKREVQDILKQMKVVIDRLSIH